ncbi:hypothetical protein EXIGLDRAFT_252938 [Exidia glandulosa HHB12029]|uniref:Uncharacterized protein n=1 Tax=Exidia glandulosa HHB12029 TaxID=1314781 RepID=A0A165DXY8_EXIGL|nr:hypothetical protein EXIGLDRAFT_252938 [Exidia glandulosa HHB12029]
MAGRARLGLVAAGPIAAIFAAASATSLPGMPSCPGVQIIVNGGSRRVSAVRAVRACACMPL